MSDPIFVGNPTVLNAADMSDDITSEAIDISGVVGFSVHSEFTGSPVGTLELKASNDLSLTPVVIDSYSITAPGTRMVNYENARFKYLIISYTFTSGTGSLTSVVSEKNE